jgi:hypothetical protein
MTKFTAGPMAPSQMKQQDCNIQYKSQCCGSIAIF